MRHRVGAGKMRSPTATKRTIYFPGGHKRSVALEDAFWEGLKEIADRRQMTVSKLVAEINAQRQHNNLVHNFLHRTGILYRFGAAHAYGSACYRPGGCADVTSRGRTDRCARLQSGFPDGISAVRAARDLAVLRAERACCVQRQSR